MRAPASGAAAATVQVRDDLYLSICSSYLFVGSTVCLACLSIVRYPLSVCCVCLYVGREGYAAGLGVVTCLD